MVTRHTRATSPARADRAPYPRANTFFAQAQPPSLVRAHPTPRSFGTAACVVPPSGSASPGEQPVAARPRGLGGREQSLDRACDDCLHRPAQRQWINSRSSFVAHRPSRRLRSSDRFRSCPWSGAALSSNPTASYSATDRAPGTAPTLWVRRVANICNCFTRQLIRTAHRLSLSAHARRSPSRVPDLRDCLARVIPRAISDDHSGRARSPARDSSRSARSAAGLRFRRHRRARRSRVRAGCAA